MIICHTLQSTGSCAQTSCPYRHNVYACEDCGLFFGSENALKGHRAGKKHRIKVLGLSTLFQCLLCQVTMPRNCWGSHIVGKKHKRNMKEQGSSIIEPTEPDAQSGHLYCSTCGIYVLQSYWDSHRQSAFHGKKEKYAAYKAVMDEAGKDKHGVTVSGNFDFGIVEVDEATKGVYRDALILLTVPASQINLLSIKLSVGSSSSFSVEAAKTAVRLPYGKNTSCRIHLRQDHRGRNEDRIEFIFDDVVLRQRFVIVRPLSAIVGDVADYELLKPKIPYKPRIRTTRAAESEIIPGILPPSLKSIPYVVKLLESPIPSALQSALSRGSSAVAMDYIKEVFLPKLLTTDSYARHFKTLLWIEEHRMNHDLQNYDMSNANLSKHKTFDISTSNQAVERNDKSYYLDVPGLAEKRPSVLVGDVILVQPHGSPEGWWYEGGVHAVRKDEVVLRFHKSFETWSSGQRAHNVRFKLNRIPVRRQHQALDTAFIAKRILFPSESDILPLERSSLIFGLNPQNRNISSNPAQLQAVKSILLQKPGSVPFIIHGPPGTGKTITVVEAISQILRRNAKARILALAPSNSAADLIAIRLLPFVTRDQMFRMYAPSRGKDQIPDELKKFTFKKDLLFSTPPLPTLKTFKVVVCTCVSGSIPYGIGIPSGHFTHIFVDEAAQASEPEVMIALKTMADKNTNVILAGDPKQLGPLIRSNIARSFGLEKSYLERLMATDIYDNKKGYGRTIVKLVKNFRSHSAILKFPNQTFYENELEQCGDPKVINAFLTSSQLVSKNFPIIFHGVRGKDMREASSPSFFNIEESLQAKAYVQALRADRQHKISDDDIGVITPYQAQCLKIRAALRGVADGIKVGSVEEFQGQERKIIIISTVRSSNEFVEYDLKHTLGFVANPRRFNVAVTRAKALLIVVGDPIVLSLDPLWRSFLNYIYNNGGWRGSPIQWDPSLPVDDHGHYDEIVQSLAISNMNDFMRNMESMTLSEVQNAGDVDANVDRPWRDDAE